MIDSRYQELVPTGSGSYGIVYSAVDTVFEFGALSFAGHSEESRHQDHPHVPGGPTDRTPQSGMQQLAVATCRERSSTYGFSTSVLIFSTSSIITVILTRRVCG